MAEELLTTGQAATRTGLTVRALRHYDAVGLVSPESRTSAGHRRYGHRELRRLQQVAAMRRHGLGLDDIATALSAGDPRGALVRRLAELDQELAAVAEQRTRLEHTIQELDMIEEKLAARRAAVGDARIAEVEQEWGELFAALEEHRVRGTDPGDPAVGALVDRGTALFAEFHGGDSELVTHASRAWDEAPVEETSRGTVSAELWAYCGAAQAAHGER